MQSTFITELQIRHVRHLRNIEIPLSQTGRKNLVLTGKNGSGKTSVLDAIVSFLEYAMGENPSEEECNFYIAHFQKELSKEAVTEEERRNEQKNKRNLLYWLDKQAKWNDGAIVKVTSLADMKEKYLAGEFILACFGDSRKIEVAECRNIEKIELKKFYTMKDKPSRELAKYLVNLKTTQAFALTEGDIGRANEIKEWFQRFEHILRIIYDNESLHLEFNIENFQFSICMDNRDKFDFNTMSMGYAAVFDIISDLMMRMESRRNYDLEGIVLIDEIETHLHVELQKKILPILTGLFPNLQFILTTHSPFILNSAANAVVYDLENHVLVEDGLTNLPYAGIVESYFSVETLSLELEEKFRQYKELLRRPGLTPLDYAKLAELELYLDEVPDYLAVDFAEEYARLKLEHHR